MTETAIGLLQNGVKTLQLQISEEQVKQFSMYAAMLQDWNERVNLTAITADEDIAVKHFVDSLSLLPHLKKGCSMTDVGTGAGFPGIPCAIIREDIQVMLVDSLDKRCKFLSAVVEALGLKNVRVTHARAEDFGQNPTHRERYDVATARAVAPLPILLEYCLPLVKQGGLFVAMKGPGAAQEVPESDKALTVLGGKLREVLSFRLPETDMERNIVLVEKTQKTPSAYPRKSGTPAKKPLIG